MITNDLEYLISKTVKADKADYAVFSGILVHNWGNAGSGAPTLEFVVPSASYVVVDGKRTDVSLDAIPALTPRQMSILAAAGHHVPDSAGAFLKGTTVIETGLTAPAARPQRHAEAYAPMVTAPQQCEHEVPTWATSFCCSNDSSSHPDGSNMNASVK